MQCLYPIYKRIFPQINNICLGTVKKFLDNLTGYFTNTI
jgi:hypothetical protein